jgi:hypothetical protein
MRTFEYRLYPTRAQRQQLLMCLMESRAIYNEMLEALKAQCKAGGTFPTKYDLTARFKGRGGEAVPATTVQTLADRLSKALKSPRAFMTPVGAHSSRFSQTRPREPVTWWCECLRASRRRNAADAVSSCRRA